MSYKDLHTCNISFVNQDSQFHFFKTHRAKDYNFLFYSIHDFS